MKSCRIFLVTSPRLPWLQTLSISGLRSLNHHSPTPAEFQMRLRGLKIFRRAGCRSFPSLQNFLLSGCRRLNHHSPTVDGWSMMLLMGTRRILSASRSLPTLRRRTLFSLPSRLGPNSFLTSTRRSFHKGIRFHPRSSPSLHPVIRIAILPCCRPFPSESKQKCSSPMADQGTWFTKGCETTRDALENQSFGAP